MSRFQNYAIAFCEEMGFKAYPEGAAIIVEMDDNYNKGRVDKVRVNTADELGEVMGREEM